MGLGETERCFLLAISVAVVICIAPEFFTSADAKHPSSLTSLSVISAAKTTGFERKLVEGDPCADYRSLSSLPAGHPCSVVSSESSLIPRLVSTLKRNNPEGGHHSRRPDGGLPGHHPRKPDGGISGHHANGGHHPRKPGGGISGHHAGQGGGGHHTRGGHRPPRLDNDIRCRRNASVCLDPSLNVYLAKDPTATTCCRTKCVSLVDNSRNCGSCGHKCSGVHKDCCGSGCVDKQTDPSNCGGCNVTCSSKDFCVGGVCVSGY